MSNSDKAIQHSRVQIPGSEFSMPAPPPEAHWTVYKITGPDGKVYIGQTGESLEVRWSKGYLKGSRKTRSPLGEAIAKFGKENFRKEALCENLTQEGAWELEEKFIELYDSMNPEKGYNVKTGGPDKGSTFSKAAKEKASRMTIKRYEESPHYRKALSESQLRLFRENPEKREILIERMKRQSAEGKNDYFIYSDHRPKPVQCVETGVIYSSLNEAFRMTGIRAIQRACIGTRVHAGGYHWRFV